MRSAVSSHGLCRPRSTLLTSCRESAAHTATHSCDHPNASRRARSRRSTNLHHHSARRIKAATCSRVGSARRADFRFREDFVFITD